MRQWPRAIDSGARMWSYGPMPANTVLIPLRGLEFEEAALRLAHENGFVCIDARTAPPGLDRFSLVASQPTGTFSLAGAFVTSDGHTTIDRPLSALSRFCGRAAAWGSDPYLPFSGGVIGYIGFEGGRALRGGAPAAGFSRHPQCRFGLYPAAVLFDHIEGGAAVVANGDTRAAAQAAAEGLLLRLQRAPFDAFQPWATALTAQRGARLSPDDPEFSALVQCARSWVRAESAQRLHVVRHEATPLAEPTPLEHFLTHREPGMVRALFTHEGAAYAVGSRDTALEVRDGRLHSQFTLPPQYAAQGEEACEVPLQRLLRQAREAIGPLCTEAGLAGERQGVDRASLDGELAHGIAALDALVSLTPFPAMTGAPFERALQFIEQHEGEHRALYGGAFGTLDANRLTFRTIQEVGTIADGLLTRTAGTDVTAECDARQILEALDFGRSRNLE